VAGNSRALLERGKDSALARVDTAQLDASFAGRQFDEALLADLPPSADPCGENGEFHTFVHAGPIFDRPVEYELGEAVVREGFAFRDLVPARAAA
jgi:diphthamide synthase (EF-2-diphthine--ammonia ligase)